MFFLGINKENPKYIEEKLQVITGRPKMILLLHMLDADYERFLTYSSLLEEELQEHAGLY